MIPTLLLGGVGIAGSSAGGGGGGGGSAWNPADKSANLTLSNADVRMTRNSGTGWSMVRGTSAKSSGKWYAEFLIVNNTGVNDMMVGIDNGSANLAHYPGHDANNYGYYSNGEKYRSDSGTAYGSSYTSGDVIGVAYDADANKVWFAKNGTWQNSGDPAAGTGEAFSSVTDGQYLGGSCYVTAGSVDIRTVAAQFTYSPPSGFTEWG